MSFCNKTHQNVKLKKEKVGVGWVEKRKEREGGMKEGISPICHVVSSVHFGNCKPW